MQDLSDEEINNIIQHHFMFQRQQHGMVLDDDIIDLFISLAVDYLLYYIKELPQVLISINSAVQYSYFYVYSDVSGRTG